MLIMCFVSIERVKTADGGDLKAIYWQEVSYGRHDRTFNQPGGGRKRLAHDELCRACLVWSNDAYTVRWMFTWSLSKSHSVFHLTFIFREGSYVNQSSTNSCYSQTYFLVSENNNTLLLEHARLQAIRNVTAKALTEIASYGSVSYDRYWSWNFSSG